MVNKKDGFNQEADEEKNICNRLRVVEKHLDFQRILLLFIALTILMITLKSYSR